MHNNTITKVIRDFLKLESASGLLLMAAALLAILADNSPLKPLYDALMSTPVELRIGALELAKPLLLWVNDGLMAVFFFLVGLELKRELLEGELSEPGQITLPIFAALGGIIVPAVIYVRLNWGDELALNGWAIPTATDIAFALGVLALLGDRVPTTLKIFLMSLAIIDDIGAIVIIAVFYSGDLSLTSLYVAAAALAILLILNRAGVKRIAPYMVVGAILWISVLKSGVHATLAGVVLAFFIPLHGSHEGHKSPLRHLEHELHPWVAYAILPLFAFSNAGVTLQGISFSDLFQPIPAGIALGLFLGKQVGVFGFSWVAVRFNLAKLPEGVGWLELYGVAVLCGIGFTMSLFIGSLAFEHGGPDYAVDDRLGILSGTFLSAILGYGVLRYALSRSTVQ